MISAFIKLLYSSFLGQIINMVTLFFVARLVSPNVYGLYAISVTIVTYFIVVSSAKYHHAIFVISIDDAEKLVSGARIFCGIISLVSLAILSTLNKSFYFWQDLSWVDILMIGLAGYLSSMNLFYNYLALKKDHLNRIALSRVLPPIAGGSLMLISAFVYGTSTALLFAYVFTLYVTNSIIKNKYMPFSFDELLCILKKNISFPFYLLPSGILETISASYILLAVSNLYGMKAAAFISMYFRIVASPQGIICTSVSDLFRKRMSMFKERDRSIALFKKVIVGLFLASTITSLCLYLFAKYLLVVFLGMEWSGAAIVFYSFIPLFFSTFLVSPVSSILYVRKGQAYDLFIQTLLIFFLFIYHYLVGSLTLAEFVLGYSIIMLCKYIIELYFCYWCITNNSAVVFDQI